MSTLPSRRLLVLGCGALLAALGIFVFPRAWTLLLTLDLLLVLLALVDWLITPGPAKLSVGRSLPERMSVQADSLVVVTVLNQASVNLRVVVRDSVPREIAVVQPPAESVVAPDGVGRELLVETFDWQHPTSVWPEGGLRLTKGRKMRVTCTWHNTEAHEVRFGPETTDEMCFAIGFFYRDAGDTTPVSGSGCLPSRKGLLCPLAPAVSD